MNFATASYFYIGHLAPNPKWELALHFHNFHELIIVLDGELGVEIRGEVHRARAGEALWYPAGVPHREWSNPQAPFETLFVGFFWPDAPATWPPKQTDIRGRLGDIAHWLFSERETHTADGHFSMNPFLQAMLSEYNRLATYKDEPLVTSTRAYIRQNIAKPFTLDDLAQRANMSKFYFVRRYKQLTGFTPIEEARQIRLQVARDWILTTELSLKEVSQRVGLGDDNRLCRLFRQYFHISPGTLRHRRSDSTHRK